MKWTGDSMIRGNCGFNWVCSTILNGNICEVLVTGWCGSFGTEIRDSWGKATFNRHLKYRVFLIIFGLWTFFVSVYCLVVKEGRLRFSHFWPSLSLSIRNSSSMEPVFWSFLAKGLATFIERIKRFSKFEFFSNFSA